MSGIPGPLRAVLPVVVLLLIVATQIPLLFAGYAAAEVQGEGLAVWVPPKMIAGHRYAGVVMTTEVSDTAREVLLVAGNPAVAVPERVVIEPGRHQAAFGIDVGAYSSSPSATVSAVMAGALAQAASTLYDGQSAASSIVRLYAFNNTSLSFARVVVTAGQSAASSSADMSDDAVTLVYPAGVAEVRVDNAKGYGLLDVPLVDGANRVSVFGRPGEEITVTRTPVDAASVNVAAASLSTVPAWTPEWGHQKSWILVDAEQKGKPIRGEFEVITTSSNPQVVEVEKARTYCRLPCAIPVMGRAEEGAAQIGVQVSGLGGSSVSVSAVHPMRHAPSQAEVEELARKYILQSTRGAGQLVINDTSLSGHFSEKAVSSSVTDGPVYGLVGHFATLVANYTVVTTAGNTTLAVPGQFSKTVPLVIPGVKYHASLGGLATIHAGYFAGLMGGDMGPASAALTGGHPSMVVGSTPVGIGSSHSAMSSFDVSLSEPVGHAELKGELAAIAIPEAGVQLVAYLADGSVRGYYYPHPHPHPHLYHNHHSVERGVLPASTPPAPADIAILPGTSAGPELGIDAPALVYPAEGLVFAAHILQSGVPVQKVEPLYELGRADPEGAGRVQEIESVFIHPASGKVARITLSAVMNEIDLDIAWPEVLRLDRPQDVSVTASVPDARIQISGDVRGTPGDSMVTLYPAGLEGDRRVVITASKAGWTGATAERVLPAMRFDDVTVDAVDGKGNPVYAPFVLQYETVDGEKGRVEDMTPFVFEVRPLASLPVLTFDVAPAEANGGKRYAYQSVHEAGVEAETEADAGYRYTGVYEAQVGLTVINGAGTGYYLPGQMVRVEAGPDRQVAGFAVSERFSHWEYDSQSVYMRDRNSRAQDVILISEADSVMTAVYAMDFAPLAVLVILTAAGVGAYAYREEIRTVLEAYRRRA